MMLEERENGVDSFLLNCLVHHGVSALKSIGNNFKWNLDNILHLN